MSILTHLTELFRHMEWADSVVWRAVLATPAAAEDDVLHQRLQHIHFVQRGFLDAWEARQPRFREMSEIKGHEAMIRWVLEYYELLGAHVASMSDGQLGETLNVPWQKWVEEAIGRKPASTTRGETMFQVIMHSHYHRAQVNTRLRELGATPPLVDFIAWLWNDRPAPLWPE